MSTENKSLLNRYAIVIGISNYEDDGIPNLNYTTNDATRLAQILSQSSQYEPSRIYLVSDGESIDKSITFQKPTRSNILNIIKYVANNTDEESEILLYFSGHGAEISKEPYLITSDTKLSVVNDTAIDVRKINEYLQNSKAKCVVRIFDACRSGYGDTRSILGRMTDGFQEAISYKAFGWATLSSCSSGESSFESPEFENGVFTHYLCEALEGKAALDDGLVTFERLVDYVKLGVRSWCDRQTLQQTPHLVSDLSGTLILSAVRPEEVRPPLPLDNPLSALISSLDAQILAAAPDVRNLTFTTPEELGNFHGHMLSAINSLVAEFSHRALTISYKQVSPDILRANKHEHLPQTFNNEINNTNTRAELKDYMVTRCTFSSTDTIIPTSELYLVTVRFSFFYWMWWFHLCNPKQLENTFKPRPLFKTGLSVYKPEAVNNPTKVDRVVRDVFTHASLSIVEWSQQLSSYVDERLGSLRKFGNIVE